MLPARWSHLVRHGLLGSTLLASPAAADPCDDVADRSVAFVVGLDFAPRVRLIGGIEARRCLSDQSEAVIRLELGGGAPRLIAGARARPLERMGEDGKQEQLGLEAGGVLDLDARFGVHLAATYGPHHAYLALQGLVPVTASPERRMRGSLLGGFAPWTAAESTAVPGRPLIRDGRQVWPALAAPLPRTRSAEDRAVRDHFAAAARFEYSSVWSFLRLAAELARAGAPGALIAAALDAADDEVRHAALCAHAAGGLALAPLPPDAARPRFSGRSRAALAILAAEAWAEGCLGEGAAAEEARLAAGAACDGSRELLQTIARDEARHAELAWAVLAWIASVDRALVVDAVASAADPHGLAPGPADPALARRGVPSPAVRAHALAHTVATARPRFAALAA